MTPQPQQPRHTILRARTDRGLIRSTHRSERFVLIELDAPVLPRTNGHTREPLNVAFVLDRSGSMSGGKLELAKRAVETAVGRLLPEDRFAVVAYDDRIDVVIESTPAHGEAKSNAIHALRGIEPRGSTNLGGGWLKGAEQVALHQAGFGGRGVHRVLLLTDGLANQGITDADELARHARELKDRGIATSTFGVGVDFDERLLTSMADAGGGHFYFIERPEQITDLIASEVGELLEVVARDAAIEITASEVMTVTPLSPFRFDVRGSRSMLLLGDLVAGQHVEAVVRIKFGYGPIGSEIGVLIGATDRDGILAANGAVPVAIGWRYADDLTNDHQVRDRSVDRRVAALFAARARQEAVKLNRLGDFREAGLELRGVAEKIREYAGDDPELNAVMRDLQVDMPMMSAAMPEMARKQTFARSANVQRSRDEQGRARR